ncbi:MAG: TonB-dependent receptor [Polyangiales bacterium]
MSRTAPVHRLSWLLAQATLSVLVLHDVASAQTDPSPAPPPAEPGSAEVPPPPQPTAAPEPPPEAAPAEPPPPPPPPAAAPEPEKPPQVARTPEPEQIDSDKLLDAVVIEGSLLNEKDAAFQAVNDVAGAAQVKDSSRELQRQGATLTAADLLSFTPGVYAQSQGGNQGIRLSIRGSGVNNTATYKTGVGFYFDGLLFPGIAQTAGVPPYFFEPQTVNYTEILPGANAFDLQPLQLGGSVNFVDFTGYTASRFQARVDTGSFRNFKGQVSSGQVIGKADYYLSLTHQRSEGFQRHSASEGTRVIANAGYKITDSLKTRFYLRWTKDYFENGGLLTPEQIEQGPWQADPAQVTQNNYYRTPGGFWWGNKTTLRIDEHSEIEAGLSYWKHNQTIGSRGLAAAYEAWNYYEHFAPSLVYRRWDKLFDGRPSNSQIAVRNTSLLFGGASTYDYSVPESPTFGQAIRRRTNTGNRNTLVSLSNDSEILPHLWLKTGIAGVQTHRVHRINLGGIVPAGTVDNKDASVDRWDWNGFAGLRYELAPTTQFFGNISRTIEPVASVDNLTFTGARRLKNQQSSTVEAGARAKASIFTGSLSYYYSSLENELLTVAVQLEPQIITAATNGTPTTHQGVEAGLDILLWRGSQTPTGQWNELSLRQAYTYSRFRFKDDPVYGKNTLPGLPSHFYQAELNFSIGGFSISGSATYSSKVFGDFANTLSVPDYVVFGANLGYAPSKLWEIHVDARNLADTHYTAYVQQVSDAKGEQARVARPGDARSIFAGLSVRFD